MKQIIFLILALNILGFVDAQSPEKIKDMYIIVLDVQNGYTQNNKWKESASKMIDSINYVINHANANHVTYLRSFHKLLNLATTHPYIYTSIDTSAKWDLDSRMNLVNENIIKKHDNNAFRINELKCFLNENNAKEIIVIGLMAEQCVFETLVGGMELGYEMYVIPEAIIGKSERSKARMIRCFRKSGINILQL